MLCVKLPRMATTLASRGAGAGAALAALAALAVLRLGSHALGRLLYVCLLLSPALLTPSPSLTLTFLLCCSVPALAPLLYAERTLPYAEGTPGLPLALSRDLYNLSRGGRGGPPPRGSVRFCAS